MVSALTNADKLFTVAKLISAIVIIIAIVLIALSIWLFAQGNTTGGIVAGCFGVVTGLIGWFMIWRSRSGHAQFSDLKRKVMGNADCGCRGSHEYGCVGGSDKFADFNEFTEDADDPTSPEKPFRRLKRNLLESKYPQTSQAYWLSMLKDLFDLADPELAKRIDAEFDELLEANNLDGIVDLLEQHQEKIKSADKNAVADILDAVMANAESIRDRLSKFKSAIEY